MSTIEDGGSAFPALQSRDQYDGNAGGYVQVFERESGMTLRDYFAAKALPAALTEFYQSGETWSDHDDLARHIYGVADAMLRAREAK